MPRLIMPDLDTISAIVLNMPCEEMEIIGRRFGYKSIPAMSAELNRILGGTKPTLSD